jgi:hypothetical protein
MISHARRGAVLVEAAIVSTFLLAFFYGGLQLGFVGLEQMTNDGAAYTIARQGALQKSTATTYVDGPTLAKASLPYLKSSNAVLSPSQAAQPPPITVGGQFNLSDTQSRHGSVSLVLPVQNIATVASTTPAGIILSFLGNINLSGIAIEPSYELINGHGNVGGNAFNSWAAFGTAASPLVNGNNAPPYFVGFNYMQQCPLSISGNAQNPYAGNASQGCASSVMTSIGSAEYLDVNNWGRALNGAATKTSVFGDALLHQQHYAAISAQLAAANTAPGYNTPGLGSAYVLLAKLAILDPTQPTGDVPCVYSFDNDNLGGYGTGTTTIGSFPLYPAGNNPSAPPGCAAP